MAEKLETRLYRTENPEDMALFCNRLFEEYKNYPDTMTPVDVKTRPPVSKLFKSATGDYDRKIRNYCDIYHVLDSTVVVSSSSGGYNIITGREAVGMQAKSLLESMAKIKLIEINLSEEDGRKS